MEGHSWENHQTKYYIAEDFFQQAMFDDTGGQVMLTK